MVSSEFEQFRHEAPPGEVGGPLPEGSPRYAYGGAYGYESGPWGQDPNDATSTGPLVLYGANPDLPPITLMHVGERWYQPEVGRFLQRDRAGIRGGLNLYSYCTSNPVNWIDSDGLGKVVVGLWVDQLDRQMKEGKVWVTAVYKRKWWQFWKPREKRVTICVRYIEDMGDGYQLEGADGEFIYIGPKNSRRETEQLPGGGWVIW